MAEGECNCGAVAYQVATQLSDVYLCHCSLCRKSTGSGAIAVALVSTQQFSWLRGEESMTRWRMPGRDWHTQFCRVCGTSLPGPNDDTQVYIPVGTLNTGTENLKVVHHFYTGSKANWELIGDSGQQHHEGFKS